MKNTRKLIFAALMSALCCVATMIIKIPTPTMGYIHPGDGVVLLAGILLDPVTGGLAAGFGSMLADLFSGYVAYAPATFIIKALTAVIAGSVVHAAQNTRTRSYPQWMLPICGGVVAELFMAAGYFFFEIFMMAITTGDGLKQASLLGGIASAASGVPFNLIQGFFGVAIAAALYPILQPIVRRAEI